jgi:hypothetical protein
MQIISSLLAFAILRLASAVPDDENIPYGWNITCANTYSYNTEEVKAIDDAIFKRITDPWEYYANQQDAVRGKEYFDEHHSDGGETSFVLISEQSVEDAYHVSASGMIEVEKAIWTHCQVPKNGLVRDTKYTGFCKGEYGRLIGAGYNPDPDVPHGVVIFCLLGKP